MNGSEYSIALDSLREATCGRDVKRIIDQYGQAECNKAWKQLSSVDRAALQFANVFQGTIIHDYQETDREERPPAANRHSPRDKTQW